MLTAQELLSLIDGKEDEHCEFKEAKNSFNLDKLFEYCIALSNEHGGRLVLGVSDSKPRQIVGTTAFPNLDKVKHQILTAVRLRVDVEELQSNNMRVLVFNVPSRPLGSPPHLNGRYLMRSGESLVAMTADQLQHIFAESAPDFSAEMCRAALLEDLDPNAIATFRERWHKKTGNAAILEMPSDQLLEDSELAKDGEITYAALVLLGTRKSLGRYLAQSEVIFEFRSAEGQIASSQRFEYRQGFLTFHDEIWHQINVRNEVTSVRDGLFRRDIPTFNEDAVREAILNAICHRDYRLGGSVFVKQYPRRLEISSPGGLPDGITPSNILRKQSPRNGGLLRHVQSAAL
jgi:ATP-dependent DNA helicase RecG